MDKKVIVLIIVALLTIGFIANYLVEQLSRIDPMAEVLTMLIFLGLIFLLIVKWNRKS